MAFLNRISSAFALGARINNPIMFGTSIAKIIASENPITEPNWAAAPITTKPQNKNLYKYSTCLERPNKYDQA